MNDILKVIAENKKREIKALYPDYKVTPYFPITNVTQLPVVSMSKRLKEVKGGIIAEFKRRSPSKGDIFPMADVSQIIPEYKKGGAAACSVLTDTRFFGGSNSDLALARTLSGEMPLLRKDFIVSKIQIEEAKFLGASAILLIAAIIEKEDLEQYNNFAHQLGLEVLVEVHDIRELDKLNFMPDMLGVNNRNLSSFHTDINHSFKLIDALPKECVLVAESGIKTPDDIKRLRDKGFSGFLIGEAFMSSPHPGQTLERFIYEISESE